MSNNNVEIMNNMWSNILYNFINKNLKDSTDIIYISSNNDIMRNTVKENPNIMNDGFRITFNKNFDINWIYYYKHIKFHMREISMNKSINLFIIKKYYLIQWDSEGLALNPNMTASFVMNNHHYNIKISDLSRNMNIKIHCILKIINHPEADFKYLSKNENLNDYIILNNIEKKWDWNYLFCNRSISTSFLIKYSKYVTDWIYVLKHTPLINNLIELLDKKYISTLDINYILSCNIYYPIQKIDLNKKININALSFNKSLNFNIIIKFKHLKWNSYNISANEKFNTKIIERNMKYFNFNVRGLEHNSNITFEFIINTMNIFDWNFKNLALLDFKKEREKYFRYFKSYPIIQ